MQDHILFSCTEFDGLHSSKHPLALGPGMAYDLKNSRKDVGGAIRVRNGVGTSFAVATGLDAGGAYRGASDYYSDGTYVHQLIAWKDLADADVNVYHHKYTLSSSTWGSWTKITADSGKFGDTALAAPTNGRVAFWWGDVPAGDQTTTGYDYHSFRDAPFCCFSDGAATRIADMDIVVNGAELGDASKLCSHAKSIPPPKGNIGVEFDAYVWADMSQNANTAVS